jgi:TonB family protein
VIHMRPTKFAFALIWTAFSIVGFGTIGSFAQIVPDALYSIPCDFQYVSVVDMQRFAESPLYALFAQKEQMIGQMGDHLATLVKYTGIDPAHDISHFIVAAAPRNPIPELIIATGSFNQKEIKKHFQSGISVVEEKYRGVTLIPIVEKKGNVTMFSSLRIAFLSKQEIALGTTESIAAVLDTRAGAIKNISLNPAMSSLMDVISPNAAFWFAGTSIAVIAKTPVRIPIMSGRPPVQGIVGAFTITNGVSGNIRIAVADPRAASNLLNFYQKIISVGRIIEDQSAGLKLLAGGLSILEQNSQINLSLNFPAETVAKVWTWSNVIPKNPVRPDANSKPYIVGSGGVEAPIPLFQPLPPYTEEARKERIEGNISIQSIIRKDGTIDSLKILRGLGHGLDESAVNTIVAKWRFLPGMVGKTPVDVMANIEVSFRLY